MSGTHSHGAKSAENTVVNGNDSGKSKRSLALSMPKLEQ
jgi:hypothetical protein